MRRAIYLFVAVTFTFLFISCKKEESFEIGKDKPANVSGLLKMKINGTQWIADNSAGGSIIAGLINITGTSKDGKNFTITLRDTVATTYVLDQRSFNAAALSDNLDLNGISFTTNQGTDTADAGGIVIITSIDKINKTISGTFKFKMFRDIDNKQKQITEGSFDKLSYSTSLPPASTTDTLRVKIDNIDWSAKSITAIVVGGSLEINASELDVSRSVGLSMPQTIIRGTYDLSFPSDYIGLYLPTITTFLASDSGKLTIIEHNTSTKRIRGNFNFNATDLVSTRSTLLTQGYFSVKYQ